MVTKPGQAETTGGGGDSAAGSRSPGAAPTGVEALGHGREFDLIRRFFPRAPEPRPDVLVGPGDDAAVVRGDGIVLSTDLSVEGVHFRRDWLSEEEIGDRAATAALSDLAAMAARPIGVLVSLALRAEDAGDTAAALMAGVTRAAARVGAAVIGGDLAGSHGPMVVDLVVVGETPSPVLRSGARPGQEVWVTGALGAAALAVERLEAGGAIDRDALVRFKTPTARVREARWLADRALPRAMLDVSDGLAGDAAHLARAGGVRIVLNETRVPVHSTLRAVGPRRALELALGGGEDYELLFTATAGSVAPHAAEFEREFDCELTRVGTVEEGEGVWIRSAGGEPTRLPLAGFQHFQPPT